MAKPKMWIEGLKGDSYLIAGKQVEPEYEELAEFLDANEILIRIPKETLLDFLASDFVGLKVLEDVYERKKS